MIMEFRSYVLATGERESFVHTFRTEVIPRMEAAGMTVLGQFSSVTDENVFAYARTFDSLEQREAQYRAFYGSEDWLGWLIDNAIGKEESFDVFLGDSETPTSPPSLAYSGVHAERFTLASARGVASEISDDRLVVRDDTTDADVTFALSPKVEVWTTPNGRGPTPALSIELADLVVGDVVLVLGAQTPDGAVARQVVKRPGV